MSQFIDLSDEAFADDWTIPKHEISEKRLIKRTPRHNIYKADWYGDVLVYEPNVEFKIIKEETIVNNPLFDEDDLSDRLEKLDLLSNKLSRSRSSLNSDFSDQADSAYSSVSSTPRDYTKQFKSEFEFPSKSSTPKSVDSPKFNFTSSFDISNPYELNSREHSSEMKAKKEMLNSTNPVILNKDSYNFRYMSNERRQFGENLSNNEMKTSWFELNELRLVAHESFMLFMGVSLEETGLENSQSASLVMQMNHPKSVSLYNLLHATKSATSPIDRFFLPKSAQKILSIDAKLNICQQVTNAMTYLHDKNIVHGKLASVNIYLELNQRVKISLIDNDERPLVTGKVSNTKSNQNSFEFNFTNLTYLSPELIRSIRIVEENLCDIAEPTTHVQIDTRQITKKSDIFSFGTLLFELFEEKFPFSGNTKTSLHELIFQIGSGHMEKKNLDISKYKCPTLVKVMKNISTCWSANPCDRPCFKQLAFAEL